MVAIALRFTAACNSIQSRTRGESKQRIFLFLLRKENTFLKALSLFILVFHWPEVVHMFTPKLITGQGKRIVINPSLARDINVGTKLGSVSKEAAGS